jgi:hypothetical protein
LVQAVSCGVYAQLMCAVASTGNFGFFNFLSASLGVSLLDDHHLAAATRWLGQLREVYAARGEASGGGGGVDVTVQGEGGEGEGEGEPKPEPEPEAVVAAPREEAVVAAEAPPADDTSAPAPPAAPAAAAAAPGPPVVRHVLRSIETGSDALFSLLETGRLVSTGAVMDPANVLSHADAVTHTRGLVAQAVAGAAASTAGHEVVAAPEGAAEEDEKGLSMEPSPALR